MPVFIPPPLFADAGGVVALLVLIFTVVGWLVNLANSQNNPPAPPPPQNRPRPPRPKANRVQNEIDIFLQDVRGQNASKEDVVLEALPPEKPGGRPRPVAPLSPQATQPAPPASRSRLATRASTVDSHVGETLSSHHLASHVGEKPPATHISKAQTGGEMVALKPLGGSSGKVSKVPIVNLFQDQNTIRQAILVNEILSKPRALRDS